MCVYIYTHTHTRHINIYWKSHSGPWTPTTVLFCTANIRTKILEFRGFDSSRISILRGGILMSIGDLPESSSQAILAGIILVGRLGVETERQSCCTCGAGIG